MEFLDLTSRWYWEDEAGVEWVETLLVVWFRDGTGGIECVVVVVVIVVVFLCEGVESDRFGLAVVRVISVGFNSFESLNSLEFFKVLICFEIVESFNTKCETTCAALEFVAIFFRPVELQKENSN